ncbi:MAG: T9SS type A sorting domain-containing protein, partial [Bacteroidales bacterium]|nr:T9SS type A sorting domain-containing protein [Bacteroidales bacterium]
IYSNYEMNGNILLSGSYYTGASFSERHSFVMILNEKMDSIGFNEFEGYIGISFFKQLDDNQYWVIEEVARDICLLDSTLSKIEEIDVPDFIFGNYSVKWDTDSSFYLLGHNLYPHPNYNLALLRFYHPIDTAGYQFNLLKVSDTTDYPCARGGVDFITNDTLFAGGTRNYNNINPYYSNQPSWFMLFQIDSQLNVRWERFYGGDAYYVMRNLIATRDGGCLIAGTRYDYLNDPVPQTDIIVLKLNSEGLLTGQNELQESLLREAIVYPNPGSTIMQVRLAVQHPKAMLELFDSQGKLLLSQQLHEKESRINTAQLPPGTYIYRLSAATGLNESGKWIKQ